MKRATGALGKKDDLWAVLVKERDDYTCQRCGIAYPEGRRQGLHAHHAVASRGKRPTRHLLANGIALDFGCHMWAHANPLEFAEMMRERLGADQFDELRRLSRVLKKRKAVIAEDISP